MHANMPCTLVATGALTNVALYLQRYGTSAVREIVLMGGSTERGKTTPYAEFDIYVGPEAAAIVFASGATVVDLHGRLGRTPNARVAVDLDVDRFFDLVVDAVGRLT
ncbi:nucleoside hydrolase [Lentzea aerocolonigenes]|uniref:nucleoside hydrolase n=1 Tax=Lentzea aerocolonigenes TaxID=68170 RepID=UPI0004C3525D